MGLGNKRKWTESSEVLLFTVHCMMYVQHINGNETGRTCRTRGKDDNAYKICSET
jgi:hypothetical protein